MVLNISNLNLIPNSLERLYVKKIMYKLISWHFKMVFKTDNINWYFRFCLYTLLLLLFTLKMKRQYVTNLSHFLWSLSHYQLTHNSFSPCLVCSQTSNKTINVWVMFSHNSAKSSVQTFKYIGGSEFIIETSVIDWPQFWRKHWFVT